jgi:DNA-binding IclR family transcriptional regulator
LSHRRDDGFGAVDDAGQIDLRDPLPFGDGQVGDEAGREHAGGVDENVDTTQVGNGFRERLFYGVRLERLGLDIVAASMSRAPRQAILESLSQQIGETCNFGVMAGSHVVYLDRVESAWPFGLRFERGSHVPLHCTSMGKLFLSTLPAPRRALMLRSIPLYRYTENTITDVGRLEEELEKIRSMEVSTDDQEFLAGVVCVAVPVHGPKRKPIAALAVSAPLARMSLQQGLAHVPLLRSAANSLAATIEQDESSSEEGNP